MRQLDGHLGRCIAEVAGPWMYRRNAFRLTGLPVHASRREIRHQRQRLIPLLERNIPVEIGGELPPAGQPSVAQLRAAFDALDDPFIRLVHELFWLWGEPQGCGCPAQVHSDHDAAVRAHARVLDAELNGTTTGLSLEEREELWDEASEHWYDALQTDAVCEHLRHRAVSLDDPRLTGAVPDDGILNASIQRALLAPVAGLLTNVDDDAELERLAEFLHFWDVVDEDIVDTVVAELSEPLLEEIRSGFADFDRFYDAADHRGAMAHAQNSLSPLLSRLQIVAPPEDHRRTAAAMDQAAIRAVNTVVAFLGRWPGRAGPQQMTEARRFLDIAEEWATGPETQEAIAELRAGIDMLVSAGPAWGASRAAGSVAPQVEQGWEPRAGLSAEQLVSQWYARVVGAGDGEWLPVLLHTWRSRVRDPELAYALDNLRLAYPLPRWRSRLFRLLVLAVLGIALWICASGRGWGPALLTCAGGVVLAVVGMWAYGSRTGPVIHRHLPWLAAGRDRP